MITLYCICVLICAIYTIIYLIRDSAVKKAKPRILKEYEPSDAFKLVWYLSIIVTALGLVNICLTYLP